MLYLFITEYCVRCFSNIMPVAPERINFKNKKNKNSSF